ncbi:ABC transporter substrate binding protein [Bacillaceae bacterium W0354]
MKKRIRLILSSVALILILAACGTSSNEDGNGDGKTGDNDKFVIGVTQIVEHPSLDRATEGFMKAVQDAGLNVEFVVENAQNDNNNNQLIAQKLVGDKVDLIFANSTPSAQSVLNETEEIPIVFTSVTDPVGAKLIDSFESPGGNVTGTADLAPDTIPNTVKLIKEMGYQSIGLVYNAAEANSVTQIDLVNEVAAEEGLKTVEKTISSSSEVKQATEALVGSADAIYIITDNTVVSALESVLIVGESEQIPVFVGELDSVARGGLAAFGFDYYDIGYEAGEKAVEILKNGKSPSEVPATYPQNVILKINEDAAERMGVELTDELKERAELVTTEED